MALTRLRAARPNGYEFHTSTLRFPSVPLLQDQQRVNRCSAVVLSFGTRPSPIAASTQVGGKLQDDDCIQLFANLGLISIDEETRRRFKAQTPATIAAASINGQRIERTTSALCRMESFSHRPRNGASSHCPWRRI